MNIIERDVLKARIDRGDDFKLVMVLSAWAFEAKHIPGSINITSPDMGKDMLDPEDDTVVYCTSDSCIASRYAYRLLTHAGYRKVQRYSGGLEDWEAAGLPLEGTMVDTS